MKIIVISLVKATERRAAIAERLNTLGLDFEFFDALNGDQGYQEHFDGYNPFTFQIHSRREPLAGEIGCYASHMAVWRKCIELGAPVLVLEDDARLTDQLEGALQVAAQVIDECGFIRLEANKHSSFPRRYDPIGRAGEFEVNYISRVSVCMTGYVIHPQAAERFLANSKTMIAPVDRFLQCPWVHGQPLYMLLPSVVVRQDGDQGSYIKVEGRSPRKTLTIKVLTDIILMKSLYLARRVIFNAGKGLRSRVAVRKILKGLDSNRE